MIKLIIFSLIIFIGLGLGSAAVDADEEEVDDILAGLDRTGDSNRLWPDSQYTLKNEFCTNFNQELNKVIGYVMKRFDKNLYMQIIFRLYVNELGRIWKGICDNDQTRTDVIKKFRFLNSKVNEIKLKRERLIAALTLATKPEHSLDLADIICYMEVYSKNIMEILPDHGSGVLEKQIMESMTKAVISFAKSLAKKEEKNCDFNKVETKGVQPKHKSIEMAIMDALFVSLINKPIKPNKPVKGPPPTATPAPGSVLAMTRTTPGGLTKVTVPTVGSTKLKTTTEEVWEPFTHPLAQVSTVTDGSVQSFKNPKRKSVTISPN